MHVRMWKLHNKQNFGFGLQKFINDWMASQNRDLKVYYSFMGDPVKHCFYHQVMTNRMGNPEGERRAEFYNQNWTKEAVTRYFYTKVNIVAPQSSCHVLPSGTTTAL